MTFYRREKYNHPMRYVYDHQLVRKAVKEAGGVVEAARKCGVSHNMMSFWSRGVSMPRADNLGRIAAGLGKAPGDFYRKAAA